MFHTYKREAGKLRSQLTVLFPAIGGQPAAETVPLGYNCKIMNLLTMLRFNTANTIQSHINKFKHQAALEHTHEVQGATMYTAAVSTAVTSEPISRVPKYGNDAISSRQEFHQPIATADCLSTLYHTQFFA